MNDNNVWDTRSSLLVLPSVAWRLANDWLLLSFQCERHTHTIQCLWSIPGSTVWVDRVVKWVYDNVVYSHNSIGTATVLTDITRFLFEEKLIVAGHIRFAHVLWKYNSLYTNCMVEGRTQVRLHCISPVEGVQSNITEVISPRDLVGSIIRQINALGVCWRVPESFWTRRDLSLINSFRKCLSNRVYMTPLLVSRKTYPLNLSISLSGGKETNRDSLSKCDWNGMSPAHKLLHVKCWAVLRFREIRQHVRTSSKFISEHVMDPVTHRWCKASEMSQSTWRGKTWACERVSL